MALSKKTYVDGVTVITAASLNAIQDEIIANASNINNKQNKTDNTLSTTSKTVVGAINELFSSVSNGKASVASAITDKGVNTSQGATFEQMATNIRAIQTGSTGITPTGTYNITRNGTYDVTNYASANVNVPTSSGGITPSGNKAITASTTTQTNIDVNSYATVSVAPTPTETKTITSNGTYTPSSGKFFSSVTVNVPTSGGSSSGGGSVSINPTSDTWQHNQYVTLTLDVDAEGNLSIRQSAGGGTTTGLKICYPQGSSTAITKIPNIPTTAGTYELPFTASWSGDSNNHTLVYTVVEGGSGSGGGSDTIGTATVTPSNNATTVTITGLKGTPKWFIFTPNTSVAGAANTKRITSHIYNGTSDFGQAINGSGSTWSTSYSVATNTTDFSHTYNNGSLTLNGGGASAGGYYYKVASTLIYGY